VIRKFFNTNLENYFNTTLKVLEKSIDPNLIEIVDLLDTINDDGGCAEVNSRAPDFFLALDILRTENYKSYLFFNSEVSKTEFELRRLNFELITYGLTSGKGICFKENNGSQFENIPFKMKYFSVRSFSAEEVIEALNFAEKNITDSGIIFVHDFLNSGILEVNEGVTKYLSTGSCRLKPFMVGFNCILFTKSYANEYATLLLKSSFEIKKIKYYGNTLLEVVTN